MRITHLLIGGVLLAVSFSAFAFIQEVQTGTGTPAHWTSSPIVYSFNARGTPEVPGTQEFDAGRAALAEENDVSMIANSRSDTSRGYTLRTRDILLAGSAR